MTSECPREGKGKKEVNGVKKGCGERLAAKVGSLIMTSAKKCVNQPLGRVPRRHTANSVSRTRVSARWTDGDETLAANPVLDYSWYTETS